MDLLNSMNLQFIWEKYKQNDFVVLAVPSNSFNQEKDTNQSKKIL